jgi:amidase
VSGERPPQANIERQPSAHVTIGEHKVRGCVPLPVRPDVWAIVVALAVCSCSEHRPDTRDARLDLVAATAVTLKDQLATGEVTALQVTQAYMERIAAVDDSGPRLNAVIELNPDAEKIARDLDAHFAEHGPKGPLHGLPVLLKANIDTGDSMATSAGSLALADHVAEEDAYLVARLREAGAVILGKANLSEWANFRSTSSTSGWSSVGGQTRNPYVLDRNPCGSSSGSAVAVAASLTALAVGTETDGSVVCPAGITGVVGIKPTVGAVSRHGIVPIAHSQDTAGPMAKSVMGAALLLEAMAGHDPRDPAPRRFPADAPSLLPEVGQTDLAGRRIGVLRTYWGAGDYPRTEAIYERSVEILRELGATIVDPIELPEDERIGEAEYQVLLYEFKADLNAYLEGHDVAADRDSLADLIAFNERNRDTVMPIFGQEIFHAAEVMGDLNDPGYLEALTASADRMREALEAVFAGQRLDALLAPTNGPAWKTDWVNGDDFSVGSSEIAAISGNPSVTVPAGSVSGLPIGVSFIGPALSEPSLIRIAYAFEQATRARTEPTFIETLEK